MCIFCITAEFNSIIKLFNYQFKVNFRVLGENISTEKLMETTEITEEMFLLARKEAKFDRLLYEKSARMQNEKAARIQNIRKCPSPLKLGHYF